MDKSQQLIKGIKEIYNKTAWLNKEKMENALKGYTSSEVHCIEYIGNHDNPNVTRLADSLYMTRGAATKITQKLIHKGIIESYQKADNKKEIHFKLTKQGFDVYKVHENLHDEFTLRDQSVFDQVTEEQFNIIIDFIDKYCKHLDKEIEKQNR